MKFSNESKPVYFDATIKKLPGTKLRNIFNNLGTVAVNLVIYRFFVIYVSVIIYLVSHASEK